MNQILILVETVIHLYIRGYICAESGVKYMDSVHSATLERRTLMRKKWVRFLACALKQGTLSCLLHLWTDVNGCPVGRN